MNNPTFTLRRNNDSPFSRKQNHHCSPVYTVSPYIHPRLTVPGQLRNARKAYGPGMVHAISTAAVTSCSPRSSLFTSSALSLVTPMTDRSAILQPGKKTHAVFEKLRATRRAACVHLFPSLPASDVTRGVLLALARSRERGTRGVNVEDATRTELFESLASGLPVTRWRDVKGET